MIVPFSFWKQATAGSGWVAADVALTDNLGVVLGNFSNEVGYYNDVEEWRRLGVTKGALYVYFVVSTTVAYYDGTPGIQRWGGGTPHLTYDAPELLSQSPDGIYFNNYYRVRVYPVAWVASASETWAAYYPGATVDAQTLPGTQTETFQVYNNV